MQRTSDKLHNSSLIMTIVTIYLALCRHSKKPSHFTIFYTFLIHDQHKEYTLSLYQHARKHERTHTYPHACTQTHTHPRTHNHTATDYLQICGWTATGRERLEVGRFEGMGFESNFKGWSRLRVAEHCSVGRKLRCFEVLAKCVWPSNRCSLCS